MNFKQQKIEFRLTCLRNVDLPEHLDLINPYLWVIFFKIDNQQTKISEKLRISGGATYRFSKESYQNLTRKGIPKGSKIDIPKSIGLWKTQLEPLYLPLFEQKTPAIIGVFAALVSGYNVSPKGIEAGHRTLNREVASAIDETLGTFKASNIDIYNVEASIEHFFEEQLEKYTRSIPQKVIQAIQGEQNLLQNFWSVLKKDKLIGYFTRIYNQSQFKNLSTPISFKHELRSPEEGTWEIQGNINIQDV